MGFMTDLHIWFDLPPLSPVWQLEWHDMLLLLAVLQSPISLLSTTIQTQGLERVIIDDWCGLNDNVTSWDYTALEIWK